MTEDLELIPRVVRDKLDRVAVKLHLREWQQLGLDQRRALLERPCKSDSEVNEYAALLRQMVEASCGHAPEALSRQHETP